MYTRNAWTVFNLTPKDVYKLLFEKDSLIILSYCLVKGDGIALRCCGLTVNTQKNITNALQLKRLAK